MNILVRGNKLEFAGKTYDCAVGKNGFSVDKKEGDLCTPIGKFSLREVYYRADKMPFLHIGLPVKIITQHEVWCDSAAHSQYNQLVELPFEASHEKLWREDDLYDIFVVIGYNDSPVISGKGSAIFMHIAKPNYEDTEGCIALKKGDLLEILAGLTASSTIEVLEQ
jgi:L,D-peptidoglycan transpeptidase YkuD (ErfK/YbiS/YcfS/YnhG family)